jgi:hypothetical protein
MFLDRHDFRQDFADEKDNYGPSLHPSAVTDFLRRAAPPTANEVDRPVS